MPNETSVDFYSHGVIRMNMCFPNGKVDCRHCRFCRFREPYALFQCILTDEFIEKYDLDTRHPHCPVEIQDAPF